MTRFKKTSKNGQFEKWLDAKKKNGRFSTRSYWTKDTHPGGSYPDEKDRPIPKTKTVILQNEILSSKRA